MLFAKDLVFDLKAAQQAVHEWMRPQKIGYWSAAYMGDKLGEEKREVTQHLLSQAFPGKYGVYDAKELGMELADLLFAVICLANTGAELADTCEGVGPYSFPRIYLKNVEAASSSGLSVFELDARLTDAIGWVCKDIQRMPQGPKRKDGVLPKIEEHLNAVAQAVADIAVAMDISLDAAWQNAIEKYNIRDAQRWK